MKKAFFFVFSEFVFLQTMVSKKTKPIVITLELESTSANGFLLRNQNKVNNYESISSHSFPLLPRRAGVSVQLC